MGSAGAPDESQWLSNLMYSDAYCARTVMADKKTMIKEVVIFISGKGRKINGNGNFIDGVETRCTVFLHNFHLYFELFHIVQIYESHRHSNYMHYRIPRLLAYVIQWFRVGNHSRCCLLLFFSG